VVNGTATYSFGERLIGAAKLDKRVYEDVEQDTSSIYQAITVVFLSSIAAGAAVFSESGTSGFVATIIGAFLGWVAWAYLTYFLGTRVLPTPQTEATLGQLLRTTGFATAPGILAVLGIWRPVTGLVFFVANIWCLIAFVIAVRQALDYRSIWRAIGVCLIGWLIYATILTILTWPRL